MAEEIVSKDSDPNKDESENKDSGQTLDEKTEERLSALEDLLKKTTQALEAEKKASSGKDKKITELQAETKNLQEKTYSQDELLRLRKEELDREKAEWEREREEEKKQLESLKQEQMRNEVLNQLENFPKFLYDRVRGGTREEVERDARLLMKEWVTDRDKVDNARKVAKKPQAGDGKQINVTAADVENMTAAEKRKWAANATPEEWAAVRDNM